MFGIPFVFLRMDGEMFLFLLIISQIALIFEHIFDLKLTNYRKEEI